MRLRILRPASARRRRAGLRNPAGRSLFQTIVRSASTAFLLWLMAGVAFASTDHIDVQQASLESREDGYYLSADFDFELKPRVADALEHGLTLYFVVEADLTRSRWYWFDEKAVDTVLTYRLTYHALTRQYRVSTGNLQLGFPSLAEAIGVMTHVRDWKIAERGALRTGDTYDAVVRMRLDTTQLPKPFQINAITNRDWTLESDRKRFAFEPR
jgi:Domain of unknown function (DUF4390)